MNSPQERIAGHPGMATDLVYLSPDIKLEPLVCRWYAWSHLLAPTQLALHLAFRLLPLLRSFVTNPDAHEAANRDPKMYGGPFMSCSADAVAQVAQLIDDTAARCAPLLALADDLKQLSDTLQARANGYSLNEFYTALPESLAGLVEFLYDTEHHAQIRLFEPLVQDAYPLAATHEILLHRQGERDRAFFMSTPRLDAPDSIALPLDFADPRLDRLAAARTRPVSLSALADELGIGPAARDAFERCFVPHPPFGDGSDNGVGGGYAEDGVRMRFFGHACVLFQTRDVSILFDPFVALEPGEDGRFTLADLPDHIDYVVLTHHHHDHFNPEMLLQLRQRIGRIVVPQNNSGALADPSMKLALQTLGFERIDTLQVLEQVALPGGKLLSLPFTGEHADLNIYSKQAIGLTLHGQTFLFLIDSDGRDVALYRRLMQRLGPIEALFIGMECNGAPLNWLYEPLLFKPVNRRSNESRRLSGADCARAAAIVEAVAAPRVFVYAMGQDPWMKYVMGLEYEPDSIQLVESEQLIRQCNQAAIPAERLVSGREIHF
jgi:L-ascorbate metabolism protein UlaG (beta-lactamase superfamily)